MSLYDAREILKKAKAEYRRALRVVDSHLRAAVAQSPANIVEAREIQNDYVAGIASETTLGPLVQPPGPVAPKADLNPADGTLIRDQPRPTSFGQAKPPKAGQAADPKVGQPTVGDAG